MLRRSAVFLRLSASCGPVDVSLHETTMLKTRGCLPLNYAALCWPGDKGGEYRSLLLTFGSDLLIKSFDHNGSIKKGLSRARIKGRR